MAHALAQRLCVGRVQSAYRALSGVELIRARLTLMEREAGVLLGANPRGFANDILRWANGRNSPHVCGSRTAANLMPLSHVGCPRGGCFLCLQII